MSTYTIHTFRDGVSIGGIAPEYFGDALYNLAEAAGIDAAQLLVIERGGNVLEDMVRQGYPTTTMEQYLGIRISADPADLPPEPVMPPA